MPGDSAPPAEPPHDYAALFGVERDRLNDLLAGLRKADWQRPSPCPGWSILGLCGHLLGGDFGLLARHRDGHYGTPPPAGASESEFVAWLDEMQAEWVGASRRLSPRLISASCCAPGRSSANPSGHERAGAQERGFPALIISTA